MPGQKSCSRTAAVLDRRVATGASAVGRRHGLTLLAFFLTACFAQATQSVSLGWKPSPDPRTTGYMLLYGTNSGTYTESMDVGNTTQASVSGLQDGKAYYFSVYAYGGTGLRSDPSNEVSYQVPATVRGRYVFYNHSAFDGNDAGANSNDDAAIATDKAPLLPGGVATLSNYTSYSRGLNGIMLDVAGLGGTVTANDFVFRIGNNDNPAAWASAPAPFNITVRPGAGADGSDRITIVWADSAIRQTWLQVTVLASQNTRLGSEDVFYFGNAVGESGNSTLNAAVTSADALRALNNVNPGPIAVASLFDYNRDKKIGGADALIALNNLSIGSAALRLINLASPTVLQADPRAPLASEKTAALLAYESSDPNSNAPDQASASAMVLGLSAEAGGWVRIWLLVPAHGPVRVWSSANMAASGWAEVPAGLITSLGAGIYEVRVPADQAGSQGFFRVESDTPGQQ